MASIACVAYLFCFALSGMCVSRRVFFFERPLRRMWLGAAFGFGMLIWFPALFAFFLGFTLTAQLLALALACAVGVAFYLSARGGARAHGSLRDELPVLSVALPLVTLCAVLLLSHTIVPRDGELYVGQSTYGDLAMHLGFISSIAVQKTFPPMYSICPDKLVGYPFLSESCGATFVVLGGNLRFSTVLSALYAFVLVIFGVYFFFEVWLKRPRKAVLATLLFFVGGGFGFWYFFDLTKQNSDNFTRAFSAFYETPTNFVENGLRWVNPIADMLVPQRALLFGWALLFPCLFLLYRGAMEHDTRSFVVLGVFAGMLPLVHTHSFLALGIASAYFFVRSVLKNEGMPVWRGYFAYLGVTLLLALPQLLIFTFPQATGALKLHWNWANNADNYVWFYIKNFGLLVLLLPFAFIEARKEDRAFFGGAIPIWIIVETIQFQPNEYDNNKLLFICFAFTCGLVGSFLIDMADRALRSSAVHRLSIRLAGALCCVLLFSSGVMTLVRECVSEYRLMSADQVSAAEFVKAETAPDATFLTNNNHNNCIAALTGRNIVCGSGAYLFYHGVDYSEREQALPLMYEAPAYYFDTMREKFDVDYVFIGEYERYSYVCDEDYFDSHYPVAYENNSVTIYDVRGA